ncbi:MAG: mechanosensitive ion channel [Calothrix sp. C42_A2020_038]|nr:mechanosensitive ion channel [Calothrix sp. C42_A2020_038]
MEKYLIVLKQFINSIEKYLFQTDISIFDIPLAEIIVAAIVLIVTQVFNGIFTKIILQKIGNLTRQTTTQIDDELITILKKPLGWLILVAGFWLAHLVVVDNLSQESIATVNKILSFAVATVIAYIIYNGSPLLGEVLRGLTVKTENALDNLLAPYIPQIFRIGAILIVILKAAEVFLGASAGAILGLLGGAGVALGLLLKDIFYDTCCAVIIYADKLFQTGDLLNIDGVGDKVKVIEVGLRSTSIYDLESKSVRKIPNSKMISGIVENYSQQITEKNILL